jgi:UDP-N-acetylglucosamine--N-acetylmuramyl-(pentapeptide) pyrophosphoryl-undecaprenol N-acetylglucosamine transferase
VRVLLAGGGTGGHLYPALAIARALVQRDPGVRPFFVGARRGIEKDVLPTTEFPHELLDLHPLYRGRPWENWRTLAGGFTAWRRIAALSAVDRPAIVVGTGGYAAGVALGYARAKGIPYVLQEQNSFPGMTVRFFSRRAREIYLGFPEAVHSLPRGARSRAVDTGNPIQPPPPALPSRASARVGWRLPPEGGRVVLVFGGSQGSRGINQVIDAWVAGGLPDAVHLIWATGRAQYEAHASREGDRVRVRPYLAPIAEAYAATDLAITRAGAMTTSELTAWGIPSILIPLPTAAADHQTANAKALAAVGAARWIPQSDLTPNRLDAAVRELVSSPSTLDALGAAARARARPEAADRIAARILAIVRR